MISRTHALPAFVLAAVLTVALAACGASSAGPSASPTPTASSTPAPTATPEPEPSPTETIAPVDLPADCSELATPDVWNEAVGDLTLQSDGAGFTRPVPEDATLVLGCDWIVGDTTGILLLISTAEPSDVSAAVTTLPGLGYSCGVSDDFGADFCELDAGAPDTEEMILARDGVWIYMQTSNRDGRALLSGIASQIWG